MSDAAFIQLLNMSCQAGVAVCFVLLARQILALVRAPKRYAYYLWLVPFIRMACPFSFESMISLMPKGAAPIPADIVYEMEPKIYTGSALLDQSVNQFLPPGNMVGSINPLQVWLLLAEFIWLVVFVLIILYGIISFIQLRKKLIGSVSLQKNVYLADHIESPFVMGILKPRIYLPSGLQKEELPYILEHEKAHVKRHDPLWKLLAYLLVSIHWFNPFSWIAFCYACKDMEMSCDEQVLATMGMDIRKKYANSLLRLSIGKFLMKGTPLAFGEGNVKERVKNIVKYRKPVLVVMVAAGIGCIVLAVSLLSNPVGSRETEGYNDVSLQENALQNPEITESDEIASTEQILEPQQIPITAPVISRNAFLGADNVILDYADDHMVIFHGYFGLFVYSLDDLMMTGAVNLEAIGCQMTQGDNYCDVAVEKDGSHVYLHPIKEEQMYIYHVAERELYQTIYNIEGIAFFDNFAEGMEEYVGFRSERRIPFPRNDINSEASPSPIPAVVYGYLNSYDGTIGNLNYVVSDMVFALFPEEN